MHFLTHFFHVITPAARLNGTRMLWGPVSFRGHFISYICAIYIFVPLFSPLIPQTEHADGGGVGWGRTNSNNRITLKTKMQSHPSQSHLISHFFRLPVEKWPLLTVTVCYYNPRSRDKHTQKHSGTSRAFFENKSGVIYALFYNLCSQSAWYYGQPPHVYI